MLDENLTGDLFDDDTAFELARELEANTPEEIRRQRAHFRIEIKTPLIVQPANVSDIMRMKLKGVTADISEGGMSAVFPLPLQVGDTYRLTFEAKALGIPLTFARCVRCRLIREDAFEVGFLFFCKICLPDTVSNVHAGDFVP